MELSIEKIRGGYYQATRDGYNLLNLSNYFDTTETKNGLTRKIYNSGVSITGTSAAITNFWINDLNISLTAGIVNLYLETENSNVTYIFKDSDGNSIIQTKVSIQKELAENTTITQMLIQVASGVTINLSCNLMIYQGNVSKPYEQYGASPSPDYLSEIETVGSNVNYLNWNDCEEGKSWTETGKVKNVSTWAINDYQEVDMGNITFSTDFEIQTGSSLGRMLTFDKDKKIISNQLITKLPYTVNLENAKYYTYFFVSQLVPFESKLKLEKGSVATPYSSYRNG